MPTGKSTRLGRILAGSQAVSAHDDAGHALCVAYSPPALPRSQGSVESCQKVVEAMGPTRFGIDRAVNAGALARAVAAQGWGLRSRLDDNEPQGLARCEATEVSTLEEGTRVSSGPWKVPRPEDPRHVVIVAPAESTIWVSGATPQVKDACEVRAWPRVDRARTEIQEHSVKRLSDHGALHTNDGRKKIVGPDRHQPRAREPREQALAAAQKRVAKQAEAVKATQDQVAASASKGPGTRLEQRPRALAVLAKAWQEAQHNHAPLAEHASALGPPRERADREVRQQTIMTVRTLLLENRLKAFMAVLLGTRQTKGSVERVVRLLFERSGARMETHSQVVYWVNTTGVSVPSRRVLTTLVEGLCPRDLREQGPPIRVCLRAMPP